MVRVSVNRARRERESLRKKREVVVEEKIKGNLERGS